jgi:hypothetical protein
MASPQVAPAASPLSPFGLAAWTLTRIAAGGLVFALLQRWHPLNQVLNF